LVAKPGNFIYRGMVVGRHDGVHQFTIGQRKGLKVALGVPAYVKAIDPESGEVQLETDQDALFSRSFSVSQVSYQLGFPPDEADLEVQIRYRSCAVPCKIEIIGEGKVQVTPKEALRAVTPGQAAVFYRKKILLGGGVIDLCS
jgi:tRNA-specific 2-thiouridylase